LYCDSDACFSFDHDGNLTLGCDSNGCKYYDADGTYYQWCSNEGDCWAPTDDNPWCHPESHECTDPTDLNIYYVYCNFDYCWYYSYTVGYFWCDDYGCNYYTEWVSNILWWCEGDNCWTKQGWQKTEDWWYGDTWF